MECSGFAVVNLIGKLMLTETFSTDRDTCIRRFFRGNYSQLTWEDCVQEGYRIAVVTVTSELEEIDMDEKLAKLKQAVIRAHAAFAKEKKKSLSDLSPRFWAAWMDLEMSIELGATFEELREEAIKSFKQFGAPGDFGYGTPCGDGLKAVYDAWRNVVAASNPHQATESAKE